MFGLNPGYLSETYYCLVGVFAFDTFLDGLSSAIALGVTDFQEITRGSAATCALHRYYHTVVEGSRKCVPSNEMSCSFNYRLFR